MLVSEALTAIRASTLHDTDTQVTDAQITVRVDLEYHRLRRKLESIAPSLYEVSAAATISSGQTSFAKPADFERLQRLERLSSGTTYYPVRVLWPDPLNANQGGNTWDVVAFERGNTFEVVPQAAAPGTYRLTYVQKPVTGYTTLAVPEGLEQIIVERAAAWVRQRHSEDPSYHLAAAADIWKEQLPLLRKRYGFAAVPGLVRSWA